MSWKCHACQIEHDDLPDCFGIEAPWPALVPEAEFETRVILGRDQCIVDDEHFFVRGHIQIPILGRENPLQFSVWSSLSEESFCHMCDRYEASDRDSDPPYFGWLSSFISVYPNTIHLKLSGQSRPLGFTPLFIVQPTDHLLATEQQKGITEARWHEIAHHFLHKGKII
ncbi:MAG: hypothetical protein CFE26_14495 [Verrucomicrobiales bacterium VVV1]|nr:MAG: hypothetical protein CFE26_14495 [Verrucomicrobiales bacterium VVV1]